MPRRTKPKPKPKPKESEKEEKVDKHPGYGCLYLGGKELQAWGFKTGDGLLDVVPFKSLKKEDIIEDIKFKGKMCAFQPFLAQIEKYENEDILFIWDPDEQKEPECNFYFCSIIETFESEKQRLGISDDGLAMDPEEIARKKQEEEEERKRKEAEEEKKREEERIAAAIKELKKPIIPKKWKDLGSYDEIVNTKIKCNTLPIRIALSRKKREFGKNIQFSDQENVDGMNIEIKSLPNGAKYGYDVYRKLTDKNIQIGGEMIAKSTQTKWYRKVNKIIQYEFNEESIKSNNLNICVGTSDNMDIMGFDDDTKTKEIEEMNGNKDEDEDEDNMNDKLEEFLEKVCHEIHEMLTNNNLVNIFEDDFKQFMDKDKEFGIDTKTEHIKEIQTFVDLNWSRDKKISNIEWMPSDGNNNNIVAVSCIENMSFDDRVNIVNKSRISTILLWNLSHILLKAQTILTAPTDIFTFKFHPRNSCIIIGGLETGQVVLWDLTEHTINNNNKKNKENNKKNLNDDNDDPFNVFNKNDDFDDIEEEKIPLVSPKMLSYIERSHTKSVGDILWLPQDLMMTSNGELKYLNLTNRPKGPYKYLEEEQFMSISGDGYILFWDIITPKQTEKEKKKNEPAKWVPIYSKKMAKSSLNENIFVDKETMDLAEFEANNDESKEDAVADNDDDDGNESSDTIFGCKMCYTPLIGKICIGTELGEFCMFNYGKINKELVTKRQTLLLYPNSDNNKTSSSYLLSQNDDENKENENKDNNKILQNSIVSTSININKEHFLDIKSICISPHFSDIYMTIGDWRFCIWRNNKLIFISPYCSSYICCGVWSPTRPAVIITAKYDGTLDIWDLMDQTHCAVYKNSPISSTAITSIVFSPKSVYHNELAVGDSNGNLRILQIPRNFAIPLNNEKLLIAQFYEKESIRIHFINKRFQKHKMQKLEMDRIQNEKKEKEKQEKQEKELNQTKNNQNNQDNNDINHQNEMDQKLENKYQKMFISFKKQLGIKDE